MIRFFIYGLASIIACGCAGKLESASINSASPAINLAFAKAKWAAKKNSLGAYYLALGYTGQWGYLRVISQVVGPTITNCTESYRDWSASDATSTVCEPANGDTVESLFAKIEYGISSGQLATAKYDFEYGVPTQIYIKGPPTDPNLADAVSGYSTAVEFSISIP
jgi:hypothetical protein